MARATKRGTQMIRAGAGRWCARAEDVFLTELGRTACVRGAAAACGFSTRALYERRKHYPDFAARWRTAEERAKERLPGLLVAATIASLDPEIEAGDLPGVNVDQAIAIVRLKGVGTAAGAAAKAGGRAARYGPREPTIEEVRDEIVGRLAAIRRHEARKGEQP